MIAPQEQLVFMSLTEAAEYSGIPRNSLHTYVHVRKQLVPAVMIGTIPGFTKEQLDAFKQRPRGTKQNPTPKPTVIKIYK